MELFFAFFEHYFRARFGKIKQNIIKVFSSANLSLQQWSFCCFSSSSLVVSACWSSFSFLLCHSGTSSVRNSPTANSSFQWLMMGHWSTKERFSFPREVERVVQRQQRRPPQLLLRALETHRIPAIVDSGLERQSDRHCPCRHRALEQVHSHRPPPPNWAQWTRSW